MFNSGVPVWFVQLLLAGMEWQSKAAEREGSFSPIQVESPSPKLDSKRDSELVNSEDAPDADCAKRKSDATDHHKSSFIGTSSIPFKSRFRSALVPVAGFCLCLLPGVLTHVLPGLVLFLWFFAGVIPPLLALLTVILVGGYFVMVPHCSDPPNHKDGPVPQKWGMKALEAELSFWKPLRTKEDELRGHSPTLKAIVSLSLSYALTFFLQTSFNYAVLYYNGTPYYNVPMEEYAARTLSCNFWSRINESAVEFMRIASTLF
eukprot:Hpha_TRINITY_DN15435_c0_g2::TRINITY_DN15435_c0_g2_i1::g.177262::m.177262